MNQNTTIETIRMIANRLLNPDSNRIDVRSDLCNLANRLEAAPQPPIEQRSRSRYTALLDRLRAWRPECANDAEIKWNIIGEFDTVEQSEPTHPLHAGYVIIDGEKREIRVAVDAWECPFCEKGSNEHAKSKCNAMYAFSTLNNRVWLAPPAVIEPEPEWEVERIEGDLVIRHGIGGISTMGRTDSSEAPIPNKIGVYRVTRKGE